MALSADERQVFEELVLQWCTRDEERRRARRMLGVALAGFVVDVVVVLAAVTVSVWLAAAAGLLILGSALLGRHALRVLAPGWRQGRSPGSAGWAGRGAA